MALRGEFAPPGDKSISHRLVLMPILAEGEMVVSGLSNCEDVRTTLDVFRTLGGEARGGGARWTLKGLGGRLAVNPAGVTDLDCANSGTTMRLVCGILAGLPGSFILGGNEQLRRRSMERVADPLRQMGAAVETASGRAPIHLRGGTLHGIEYINNDASAQIKGAVLLAGLSASGPTRVIEPVATRDHTEKMINYFGGQVVMRGLELEVSPGRLTLAEEFECPADPSAAAYFLTAAALIPGSLVTARGILLSGTRIGFLKVLDRMGANISISLEQERPEPNGHVTVEYKGHLTATEINAEEIPSLIDEIPILALAAASAHGTTVFRQVRELRLKETDRLTGIKHQLGALGIRVWVENDDLFIDGPTKPILPESLDSGGDHRMAMMLHIAALLSKTNIPVLGDESMAISYPCFRRDMEALNRST